MLAAAATFSYIRPVSTPFHSPVKRSITIAGHPTSISLEPIFWSALEQAARGAKLPLSALVAQIDAERIALTAPPNLASAIRVWLFAQALSHSSATQLEPV
ncbi:ribbon-helix-helix domain-containing protein [Sphingomonas sp.]|jgi:predicted DNA-binding ribbon-helix-helix protein|uniref:ribbon-helix-helix domain-containing protein n=1 Tax=Sphingomonas sp. TaxID=28214 RepID=UPI002DE6B55C|nr:ribbon-helix-helix domain-containing protein [Sphingomonas sp.]